MIVECTVSMSVENSRWPEYTWLDAITPRGDGGGRDPTPSSPTYVSMVRVMLRQVNDTMEDGGTRSSTEVWLMPTRHTPAIEPRCIGREVVTYAATVDAAAAAVKRAGEFIEEALYGGKLFAVDSRP